MQRVSLIDDVFIYCNKHAKSLCAPKYASKLVVIEHSVFPDNTPNIVIPNMDAVQSCENGAHIVYYSQWATMEEKKMEELIVFVLASTQNVKSMVVVDPYDPLATMERVTQEGVIATANADAHFWKTLPLLPSGAKVHRIIYDHHTLQNRFYFSGGNTQIIFGSAMPLILDELATNGSNVDAVAFPDDGAHKRFHTMAQSYDETIVCGKTRTKDDGRSIVIQSGKPEGKHVLIVDDLVRSGGTLIECFKALVNAGASRVSFFVTHAQFPNDTYTRFVALEDTERDTFGMFFVSNSIPRVTDKLQQNSETETVFTIIDLAADIYSHIHRVQAL